MAKKDKNKKGDDVLKYERKVALQNEIKSLESFIFVEQQKIIYNKTQVEKYQKEMEQENNLIHELSNEGSKKVNLDQDNLKKVTAENKKEIDQLQKQIIDDNYEIVKLEDEINQLKSQHNKDLEAKNQRIASERATFEALSSKFQKILQRTADKLQERVDMGK